MRRYLETLFRRKDIFFVPLIVTPIIALGLLVILGGRYEISATLWVERSPFLAQGGSSGRGDTTPNEIEAQALNEWLSTETFRGEVLERSGLAARVRAGDWPRLNGAQQLSRSIGLDRVPLVSGALRMVGLAGPATQDDALGMANQMVRTTMRAVPEGNNLMKVTYIGTERVLGRQLVEAVIATYQDWSIQRRSDIVQEALDFQARQVEAQQARVTEAAARVTAFIQANPAPRTPDKEAELGRLQRAFELEQSVHEDALRRLGELRLQASETIAATAFQVVDPAREPTSGGIDWKLVLMTLVLGVLIGAGLGATGIALIAWTDSTVRSPEDVQGILAAPVTGQVPAMEPGTRSAKHVAWLVARNEERS